MSGGGGGPLRPRWLLHAWCCLFFSQFHPIISQSCNPTDLAALRGFFDGLNSSIPGWENSSSTTSSHAGCCGWPGVSCDPVSGRVVGIDLAKKKLRGSISVYLASLDHLKSLNLSSNRLRGVVPPQLLRLQQLARLDLSLNELSGSFPPNLSLPAITIFNISCNSFNGTLPVLSGSIGLSTLDMGFNSFTGGVDAAALCSASPRISVLKLSENLLSGEFPLGFANCSSMRELALDMNGIRGSLPEELFRMSSLTHLNLQGNLLAGSVSSGFGNLSNLVQLDLSMNAFSGMIPSVFGSLKKLELFAAYSNRFMGVLPASLSNSSALKVLNVRNNSLHGGIDLNFTVMAQLSMLDLASNLFTGVIPDGLSRCSQLETLNLARNRLAGEIPDSFRSFASLLYLSLSINGLSNVSSALKILQHCPELTSLVLTNNFHGEMMPIDGIQGFPRMEVLVLANCGLIGSVPNWLASSAKLKVLDLSWNHLAGTIPSWIGNLDSVFYLDLSNNSLAGEIPNGLTQMKGLVSRNSSQQQVSSIQDFPFFIRRNTTARGLQYNQVSSFPPSLILSYNKLVGSISPDFGGLKGLHVLDLSKNRLSGTIPQELSAMVSLESLDLSGNNLSGSIPSSLTQLSFLSSFSVAYNNLVGAVPSGGQFSTFPIAAFEGNPGLCGSRLLPPCESNGAIQSRRKSRNRGEIAGMAIGIGLGTALLLAMVYIAVSRSHSGRQGDGAKEVTDADVIEETAGPRLVLLFQDKDNKKLSIRDILESTDNFNQANIVGCGGFGLVYKATLADGTSVAIKRLSGDSCQMEREFQAEVETLSRVQHRNLVPLQGYCRIGKDRLLIYSYMENGSLDYWLHEKFEGGSTLDWSTRLHIAQGAARGLAYLHQSCEPHILHRDIKSSNILLDENFEAHLADFGLARLILPCDTHVTTDLVGTLGYIPPEYSQSSVATFKGDVYSFGVVLLELLTGRRPVDMCKPRECRDLISWVFQMKKEKRETEVFDPFIYDKENEGQLMQVLQIACLCSSVSPKLRPSTQQLVAWLNSIGLDNPPMR